MKVSSFVRGLWALTHRDLKKWYKDPFTLAVSVSLPLFWIALFGKVVDLPRLFPEAAPSMIRVFGTSDYFSFLAVGTFSWLIVLTTMFSGMSLIWDRKLGFLDKVLSTPVPRSAVILGKMLEPIIRALVQVPLVFLVSIWLGLKLGPSFSIINLLGVLLALLLIGIGMSAIFVAISLKSMRWETHTVLMNLITMPILFASNALLPTDAMPEWLQIVTRINPITYTNDAVRQLLLVPTSSWQLVIDFVFLAIFALVCTAVGIALSWRYLAE